MCFFCLLLSLQNYLFIWFCTLLPFPICVSHYLPTFTFFFFSEPGDALKDAVLLVALALLLIYMYMCVFVRQWEVFTVKPRFQRTPVEEYCLSGSRHRALKKLVSEAKEVLFSPLKAQRRHRLS